MSLRNKICAVSEDCARTDDYVLERLSVAGSVLLSAPRRERWRFRELSTPTTDPRIIAGREFRSRTPLGTGKFFSNAGMTAALEASGTTSISRERVVSRYGRPARPLG